MDIRDILEGKDAIIALVSAALGGFLSWLGSFINESVKRRHDKIKDEKEKLADALLDIAKYLGGMIGSFQKRKIPHTDGRAFIGLYGGLEEDIEKHLPDKTKKLYSDMNDLAQKAIYTDQLLYIEQMGKLSDVDLKKWILAAERFRGDLLAAARRVRNS